MNVLMITGDKNFGPGNPRYELQRAQVNELAVVYWARGSLWPKIPAGHFDVVTAQDPFWRGLFAWKIARHLGAKFNVQVHADLRGQSLVKRVLAQIVLRHADSVRVVSAKIKEQVEHIGTNAPIYVLPIYVDTTKFNSVVRKPHVSKNILWIGRFEEEKNPLQAIDILKEVLINVPDARLTMLGQGSLSNAVSKHAANLPIQAVAMPGWQNPVVFLDTADVVLSTSWHESFGASIIEALAAGVPVVAPDVGVAKEAGAIVVPRQELAQAVINVLKSGQKGELKLPVLSAAEWAQKWKESLQ